MIASPVNTDVRPFFSRALKIALWLIVPFIILTATGVYFLNASWPYRYNNVEPLLNKVFASQIKMDHYHRTYFPNPGFVATGLTLRLNSAPDAPPIGSASNQVVQGRWTDLLLFRYRVRMVGVEGLHIVLPAKGSRAEREDCPPGSSADFSGPPTIAEQLNIHSAILDIMRTDGNRYTFPIHQLIIHNLRQGGRLWGIPISNSGRSSSFARVWIQKTHGQPLTASLAIRLCSTSVTANRSLFSFPNLLLDLRYGLRMFYP